MAILAGDIKLVKSQNMSDNDEGGGAPTSNVIQDGFSNSIFPDISELNRAAGAVHLRKVFPTVQTNNTDSYLGANVIVAESPEDPNVSVTLFKTDDVFDVRTDARNRIESYLNKSSTWDGFLFENHIAGQKSIQIFHREVAKPPVPGKTLCLVASEGLPGEYEQYVRTIDVTTEVRTFSYQDGNTIHDYTAAVSTCELSDALLYDFPGSQASRLYTPQPTKTVLRDTLVADAAAYYGASKTSSAITLGDRAGRVESIFTKLVPSAQTETPLTDQSLTGASLPMVACATTTVTRTVTAAIAASGLYVLPSGCLPGTLSINLSGSTFTDDGAGNVILTGSTVGTIKYATGEISFNASAPTLSGACVETYRPAVAVSMQNYTYRAPVTAENRGAVWVGNSTPLPAPQSVVISFMAQGNWYDLRDDGAGVLRGTDSSYGVGTISYVTGSWSITTGALPDVGTEIIVSWGTKNEFVPVTTASISVEEPKITFDLGQPVTPSTLTLHWTTGGVPKSATDNGSGLITGDATGVVNYGNGTGYIRAATLPSADAITVDYETGTGELYGVVLNEGTTASFTLPNAPIKPKSVVMTFTMRQELKVPNGYGAVAESSQNITVVVKDDGAGNLTKSGQVLAGSSINYTTGAVIISMNEDSSMPIAQYETRQTAPYFLASSS